MCAENILERGNQGLNYANHNCCSEADQLSCTGVDETDRDRLSIVTELQELFGPQCRALPAPTLRNGKSVRATREPRDRRSCCACARDREIGRNGRARISVWLGRLINWARGSIPRRRGAGCWRSGLNKDWRGAPGTSKGKCRRAGCYRDPVRISRLRGVAERVRMREERWGSREFRSPWTGDGERR